MKNRYSTDIANSIYSRKKLIIFILTSFYAMGVLWHALPPTFPLMMILTPYVLLIFGLFIFGAAWKEGGTRLLWWAGLTFLGTFLAEVVGVATGAVFGEYVYGDVLGVKLFRVPLIIGFNWTIVILGIAAFLRRFVTNRVAAVLLTAVGGVLFDLLMEPIAMALGYWTWGGSTVPLQNYLAWFLIGIAAAAGYMTADIQIRSIYPPLYVLIQACFFVALRFVVL